MSKLNRYAGALAGLLLMVFSAAALAKVTCSTSGTITLSMPASITAPRDASLGTPLTPWVTSAATRIQTGCTANDTSSTYLQAFGDLPLSGKSVMIDGLQYPIFTTSLRGVGLILGAKDVNGAWVALTAQPTDLIKGWSTFWDANAQVRLVSTGEPIASGTLSAMTVGEIWVREKSTSYASSSALIKITPTSATAQTCSVSSGSVNVPVDLGTVSSRSFTGPVGTTVGNASFDIRLDCPSGANVYMMLTDANNLGNTSDTLTLSPSAGQATGVGIQVRRSGMPVSFGPASSLPGTPNQLSLGTAIGGVMAIPFTANYIKTAITVTPGNANAVATYTLSYQ